MIRANFFRSAFTAFFFVACLFSASMTFANACDQEIKHWTNEINRNPNNAVAYNNRGLIYDFQRKFELAIQDFSKAIKINPNYDEAYNNRGSTYFCLKNYEKALKDFEKALKINPKHIPAKNNRDNCLEVINKLKNRSRN